MKLTEFLLARIAEDEAVAEAASAQDDRWVQSLSGSVVRTPTSYVAIAICQEQEETSHIARHDPERVLAECEAKRLIVARHRGEYSCETCADEEEMCEDSEGYATWYRSSVWAPCPTLRLLALPYADHPDYQQEWAVNHEAS